ncbi:MAG TPA: Zn-ribbon domain-containing OB-fold protein [Micropepsaceae bacterium]|nr:Zn-ribbon domain-containing OB-fold protein [Micropepsaceae bacterium]
MDTEQHPRKPSPRPSPESLPFWNGAKAHRLMLPRCHACGQFWFPPSQRCRHCLSSDFAWEHVAGTGCIYSFVVYHRVYHPAFEAEVPYVVAIVELDEGPRLLTNIVGTDPDDVRCDARVRVVFEDTESEMTIPKFEIAP